MPEREIKALICPNCGKLISSDEEKCPYCGIERPGARWKRYLSGKHLFDSILTYIIYVNIAFYVISILFSPSGVEISGNPLSFLAPSNRALLFFGATGTVPLDQFGRWWTLVSANYLHGSLLHIFFNMMALRQIGPLIINEYGAERMVVIYTLGGVTGYLVSYFAGISFTIGASAAICGLIGAALYYGKSRGGTYGQAVYRDVMGWVIALAVLGLAVRGINNWGHGGGILGGILFGFLLGYRERRGIRLTDKTLAVFCIVVTAVVLLWAFLSGAYLSIMSPYR